MREAERKEFNMIADVMEFGLEAGVRIEIQEILQTLKECEHPKRGFLIQIDSITRKY